MCAMSTAVILSALVSCFSPDTDPGQVPEVEAEVSAFCPTKISSSPLSSHLCVSDVESSRCSIFGEVTPRHFDLPLASVADSICSKVDGGVTCWHDIGDRVSPVDGLRAGEDSQLAATIVGVCVGEGEDWACHSPANALLPTSLPYDGWLVCWEEGGKAECVSAADFGKHSFDLRPPYASSWTRMCGVRASEFGCLDRETLAWTKHGDSPVSACISEHTDHLCRLSQDGTITCEGGGGPSGSDWTGLVCNQTGVVCGLSASRGLQCWGRDHLAEFVEAVNAECPRTGQ